MAAVNATIPQKTLRIGVNESLYVASGGAVQTTGAMGAFGLPPQSSNYRGIIWFEAVPVGGTVTALTFQLEASLDGGTTFLILNRQFGVTGSSITLTSYSGIAFGTLASGALIGLDISGLGGNGSLRMNFTTVTLGTGTGANIYAHIG